MHDLAILGLARDCEPHLKNLIEHVYLLRKSGISVRLIVGEDGSRDSSREILRNNADLEFVDTGFISAKNRLEKLAMARELVKKRYENGEPAALVAVVDMDADFVKTLTTDSISDIGKLLVDGSFFAVGATSTPYYYDLLSYKCDRKEFSFLTKEFERLKNNPVTFFLFKKQFIAKEQENLTRTEDIICESSFNGLCIYPGAKYRLGSYVDFSGEYTACEHVTLNDSIALQGGRMLIYHKLVVKAPDEHVYTTFRNLVLGKIYRRFKGI